VIPLITDINREVTESLAERIGRHRFDLWFTAPHGMAVCGEALRITAADSFSLGRIRAQFDGDLRAVIERHEALRSVIYEVSDSPQSNPPLGVEPLATTRPSLPAARPNLPAARPSANVASSELATPALPLADFAFGRDNILIENGVKQILTRPGQISPLYVHGPVGCGKSMLLQRLVQALRGNVRRRRGMYVTAEQFTGQFVEALSGRRLPMFRRKFRELDVLAVDDLQFFHSKHATLNEFQSTIDHFLRGGRQVLLAADRPPADLTTISPELRNRLSSGLLCTLNYPCQSARSQILRQALAARELALPDPFVTMVAERLDSDVRRLLGAVNRLHAAALAEMDLTSWTTIQTVLHDSFQSGGQRVSIESIEGAVCDVCGVPVADLRSPKRSKRINAARSLAIWLARKHTGSAFSEIGLHYGGRSHSTVISAQNKVSQWLANGVAIPLASNPQCLAADAIQRIEAKLRVG
jgi:chromosomal replication initiator protein